VQVIEMITFTVIYKSKLQKKKKKCFVMSCTCVMHVQLARLLNCPGRIMQSFYSFCLLFPSCSASLFAP